MNSQSTWRTSHLCRETGLSSRTLRYYEQLNLLCPKERDGAGQRLYTQVDIERLWHIQLLRLLGIELLVIRNRGIAAFPNQEQALTLCIEWLSHLLEHRINHLQMLYMASSSSLEVKELLCLIHLNQGILEKPKFYMPPDKKETQI